MAKSARLGKWEAISEPQSDAPPEMLLKISLAVRWLSNSSMRSGFLCDRNAVVVERGLDVAGKLYGTVVGLHGLTIGIDRFGVSAPAPDAYDYFGLTPDKIAARIEGAPAQPAFGKQIFGVKQGRSVIPHGHSNMCTGFIVLKGTFRGRHYDRLEDDGQFMIIRPTVDRPFGIGEHSTVSDYKDKPVRLVRCDSNSAHIEVHTRRWGRAAQPKTRPELNRAPGW